MSQKKPFSSSLGIFTNLYTIFTDFSPSRSQQQQLEEAKFPSLPPQQGQGKDRLRVATSQKPQSQAHRKGLPALSLLTALPTPCPLQLSLPTPEFNSGKEHRFQAHITDTEPSGFVMKVVQYPSLLTI